MYKETRCSFKGNLRVTENHRAAAGFGQMPGAYFAHCLGKTGCELTHSSRSSVLHDMNSTFDVR